LIIVSEFPLEFQKLSTFVSAIGFHIERFLTKIQLVMGNLPTYQRSGAMGRFSIEGLKTWLTGKPHSHPRTDIARRISLFSPSLSPQKVL
jgi:hypothetical protein